MRSWKKCIVNSFGVRQGVLDKPGNLWYNDIIPTQRSVYMLTHEDLQAIATLIDDRLDNKLESINKRLDSMDKRLDSMDERFDGIDKRLDSVEEQLAEVKENGEVTRTATEEILKWLDKWYRNDYDKKFPVDSEAI